MAGITLARTLWLQGHPDQAVERARQTVEDADAHGPSGDAVHRPGLGRLGVPLGPAISRAPKSISIGSSPMPRSHSLGPYLAVGRGFKGELAIRRGDAEGGVESLQDCLEELHAARYELLTTPFNISLVQGLAAIGRFAEGIALIDETIRLVEANGDLCYMPELLRVKGSLFSAMPQPGARRGGNVLQAVARTEPSSGRPGLGVAHRDRSGGAVGRARADPSVPGRCCSRCSSGSRRARIRRI